MNKALFITLLSLLSIHLISQEWRPMQGLLLKKDNNIVYMVDSTMSLDARNDVITKTKAAIEKDLKLLNEADFNELITITLVSSRDEIHRVWGKRASSMVAPKDSDNPYSSIGCVYNQQHLPLNRELMKIITSLKWGAQTSDQLNWVKEGLATYATPEADGCDGLTLEQRYVYLLQNQKLTNVLQFPLQEQFTEYRIARYQAAYLVSLLVEKQGIEKVKKLWISGMPDFEKIYGTSLDAMLADINKGLKKKYKKSIPVDWDVFIKDCIDPQPNEWLTAYNKYMHNSELDKMVTKEEGNIKLTVYAAMPLDERKEAIANIKMYIDQNLALVNETPFTDSIHITLVPSRNDMSKYFDDKAGVAGMAMLKNENVPENTIHAVYGTPYSPLKHELMHMVVFLKWGYSAGAQLDWLTEGLAALANLETLNCDGHTNEERYVYFLQNNKLLGIDELVHIPNTLPQSKIAYSQSAYMVAYLLERYGTEKIKSLWYSGQKDFEEIYGSKLEEIMETINSELHQKYPNPIDFNWEMFQKDCVE